MERSYAVTDTSPGTLPSMSKRVCRSAVIELAGHDISDHVHRWSVTGTVGEIYTVELTIVDYPGQDVVTITTRPRRHVVGDGGQGGSKQSLRACANDKIEVRGTDVSNWVTGYDRITRAGHFDTIVLHLMADEDVLKINGVCPWVDAELSTT